MATEALQDDGRAIVEWVYLVVHNMRRQLHFVLQQVFVLYFHNAIVVLGVLLYICE